MRKAELDNVLADHGCLATPRPSPSSPEEAQTCLPPICPPGRPVLLLSEERSTRKTPLHQELPHMLGKNKERCRSSRAGDGAAAPAFPTAEGRWGRVVVERGIPIHLSQVCLVQGNKYLMYCSTIYWLPSTGHDGIAPQGGKGSKSLASGFGGVRGPLWFPEQGHLPRFSSL